MTNQFPPPPEGPTVETVERTFKKRRGGLAAVVLMLVAVFGLVTYGCAATADRVIEAVEESPAPTSPAPELPDPPSQKVLQMKAKELFHIARTRPADDYAAAFSQLLLAYSPTGCQFADMYGLAKTAREAREEIASAKEQLRTTVPSGYGDPSFVALRGRFQGQKAWYLLAMICPEAG